MIEIVKRRLTAGGVVAVVAAAVLLAKETPVSVFAPIVPEAAARPLSVEHFARMPMAFEANGGQTDPRVRFISRGAGYSLFLAPTEAVFALASSGRNQDRPGPAPGSGDVRTSVVRMSVVGANPNAAIQGRDPQAARSHYLKGRDPKRWQRNVERYGKVQYSDIYPGIDLVFYGNQRQLEYDFVIEPGHKPERIALDFDGVESLRLDLDGNLVLRTAAGDLVQRKPVMYQEVAGVRRPVSGGYRLVADKRVAFRVGAYDASKPLVIDPVLAYSSYLGGSGLDAAVSVATDAEGNVYVVGSTTSSDFPLSHAGQSFNAGNHDAFIAKFSAHNNQLLYSTYVGGGGEDYAIGVAVDSAGNAFVTGTTASTDFPVHAALQPEHAAGSSSEDAYLIKLNASGNALVFGTYLGGTDSDWASAIDLDDAGNVYVAGGTCSVDFPTSFGRAPAGACDAFVSKLNAAGSQIVYSTYLGGDGYDMANGLDVDGNRNAHVAGWSFSTDFPDTLPAGERDAFAAKLTAEGDGLVYAWRLGGTGNDEAFDIAIDSVGTAYVVGRTAPATGTTASDFPTTPSSAQPIAGGGTDGFVVSLREMGGIGFSTFHGGSGADELREIVLAHSLPYVVGFTTSTDLPVYSADQRVSGGGKDAFVGRYLPDGRRIWSSYLGGTGEDYGFAIAAHGPGNVYVAGATTSSNLRTIDAQQAMSGGGEDGYLVRFGVLGYASYRPDFDSDLGADVLWRNTSTGANVIWKEADASTPYMMATVPSQSWIVAGTGYFNDGDWVADILWRNTSTGQNVIWLSGDSRTPQAVATVSDQAWKVVAVADFDDDLQSDIFWRHGTSGANVIWRSGNSATPQAVNAVTDIAWKVVGAGDFDGDGKADILWRHDVTGNNAIWRSGNSTWPMRVVAVTNPDWKVAGIGDFLNDGKADILWRNQRTGANVIWRNAEYSSPQTVPTVATEWQVAAVGDYSGDGRSDIFWRNGRTGKNAIWKSASPELQMPVAEVSNLAWKVAN